MEGNHSFTQDLSPEATVTSGQAAELQLLRESLYCKDGGSDKEYHIAMKVADGGYVLETRHGKRGAAKLQPISPLMTYEAAVKAFNRVVAEKTSPKKKYTRDPNGLAYAESTSAGTMSGNMPHLLVPITIERMNELIEDDGFGFQEKIDGERLMVEIKAGEVVTSNKLGVINSVPQAIVEALKKLGVDYLVVDGESKDGNYHIFDLLLNGETNLRHQSGIARYDALCQLLSTNQDSTLKLVKMHFTTLEKRKLVQDIIRTSGEGIVAKELGAPYVPGRATSKTATQFKWVITENASCFVIGYHPTKLQSINMGMLEKDGVVYDVGNVTFPKSEPRPEIDSVHDLRYRHLYQGGKLCQPVFVKSRTDVLKAECLLSQITRVRVKHADDEEESED